MPNPCRNPRVATRTIEGVAVAVSPDDAMLHRFDEIGTFIWELADGSRSFHEIASEITGRFDVGQAQALKDVEEFCNALVKKNILITVDS